MTRLLPILPLRDIVVFPQRIVPLFVGREKSVAALEAAGGEVTYVEIAGGTHGSMVAPSTARIMEFFSKH